MATEEGMGADEEDELEGFFVGVNGSIPGSTTCPVQIPFESSVIPGGH